MEAAVSSRVVTRSKLIEENDKPVIKDGFKRAADQVPDVGNKKRILGDITNQPKISSLKYTSSLKQNQGSENSVTSLKNETTSVLKSKGNVFLKDSSKNIDATDGNSKFTPAVDISTEEPPLPEGVVDFDKTQKDLFSESRYARDIFKYYLEREKKFVVSKYLDRQKGMTKSMRAILVDWMVEVQESFELNHETLYLAVKLVDHYLMKNIVSKSHLQLIGATAICIASKFDERNPPALDDFIYICDDSYTREQMIKTEIKILQTIDFDLGIPLSYRFLRRYARCSRLTMEMLTLARYILESSLMEYELIEVLDSKLAAAALLLAIRMKHQTWTPALEYYSGYKEADLTELLVSLNKIISPPFNVHLKTIRTKYSHSVFFEVSKVPPLNIVIKVVNKVC